MRGPVGNGTSGAAALLKRSSSLSGKVSCVCIDGPPQWFRHRDMSPALYVSVSPATRGGLCRFGEAWAALWAEILLTQYVTRVSGH